MKSSRWITQLHKKYKDIPKPDIRKTKQYSICKYTIYMKKKLYQISFYSKDNFRTIAIIEIYNPKSKNAKVIKVNRAIPEDIVEKIYASVKSGKFSYKTMLSILSQNKKQLKEDIIADMLGDEKEAKKFRLIQKVLMYLQIVNIIVVIIFLALYIGKVIRNISTKIMVDKTENEVNKKMFEGQSGHEPEFEVYSGLIYNIKVLLNTRSINGLLVLGPPGTGKTYVVRRTLYFSKIPHTVLKGTTATEWDVYAALYKNRNKILVLDDFDVPWTENLVALIKAATDTSPKRMVYFPHAEKTANQQTFQVAEIPNSFVYTGKLIILANKKKEDIPAPVRSRMPTFVVDFNVHEMLNILNKMLKYIRRDVPMSTKQEVLDYIASLVGQGKVKRVDFRTVEIAIDLRLNYPDKWKSIVVSFI